MTKMEKIERLRQDALNDQKALLERTQERELAKSIDDVAQLTRAKQDDEYLAERKSNLEALEFEKHLSVVDKDQLLEFDPMYRKLASILGIEIRDISKYSDKLRSIFNWASIETGDKDPIKMLTKITSLKRDLGFREIGETALNKLHSYMLLDLDSKRIEVEKQMAKL